MNDKIDVEWIEIMRVEGLSALCYNTKTFRTFDEANEWLLDQSETFPHLGYDKHDFKVIFCDGHTYEGRLDCKHHTAVDNDLNIDQHIREHLFWLAGMANCPIERQEAYNKMMIDFEDRGLKQQAIDFLETYNI